MFNKETRVFLSLFLLIVGFQNCAPSLSSDNNMAPDISQETPRPAYKAGYSWTLEAVAKKGERIQIPDSSSLTLDLNIEKNAPNPDLLCAGSCPETFKLNVVSNCQKADGLITQGWSESEGLFQTKISLNKTELSPNCSTQEWEAWLINLINSASNFELNNQDQIESLKFINQDIEIKFKRISAGS